MRFNTVIRTHLFVCFLLSLALTALGQSGSVGYAPNQTGSPKREEAPLDRLRREGAEAQRSGRFADAEKLYMSALEEAEKLGDADSKLALVLRGVSLLYSRKGDEQGAIAFGERALAVDERAFGPNHPLVAEDLTSLARLYSNAHKLADAEKCYQRALEIEANAAEMDGFHRLGVIQSAAMFYQIQKSYAEAEALRKRALDMAQASPQRNGLDIALLRRDLAFVYRAEGKQEEADELLSTPLPPDAATKKVGRDPDISSPMIDRMRAEDYKVAGKYADAEAYYNRAITTLEKTPGPSAAFVLSQALDSLANLYHAQHRDSEAEQLFLRAVGLREKSAGPKRLDLARVLSHPYELLNFYRKQGRLSEMEPIYKRILEIQEALLGPRDEAVGWTLADLAHLYREEGKYEDAVAIYARVVQINETNLAPDDRRLANVFEDYAGLLQAVQRDAEASEFRTRAEQIQNRKPVQTRNN